MPPALLGCLLLSSPAAAQQTGAGADAPTGSLEGRVLEASGGAVSGVFIRARASVDSLPARAAVSDDLGYWHLEGLSAGTWRIRAVRLGYASVDTVAVVGRGARTEVGLVMELRAVELEGLSVEAERSRERARFEVEAGLTIQDISATELANLPGLVEPDPLRAVEVLPGVITTSDFSSAFNVRGGSADQNLILLDGMPVFNPTHLGGIFSIFNSDMVERTELRTGGFPPEYGGRVSSVMSVETDPGDGELGGEAGISLLATRLALGGGLPDGLTDGMGLEQGRWRISGRRSYFDLLLRPFVDFPYHLTDAQGFFEGWTRGGDRITLSAYSGRDRLDLTSQDAEDFPLRIRWGWGNDAVGLRWSRPRDGGGALRGIVSWSRFSTGLSFPDFQDSAFESDIDQLQARLSLETRPRPSFSFTAGVGADRYGYANRAESGGTAFNQGRGTGWQGQAWLQTTWERPRRWLVEGGLRADAWLPSPGESAVILAPRASAKRFLGDGDWALKASAGRYSQFLHSLRDEELPLGLDVWILSGKRAPAVVSDQVQGGVEGFPAPDWFVSLEGYRRSFDGVVTTNGAEDPNDPDDDLATGTGLSWGVDLLVQRTVGETTGWVAVSWLRATRTFPDFLSGAPGSPGITYPPIFDRRLDVDLVLNRSFGSDLEVGIRWNLGSGLPYTRPRAVFRHLNPRSIFGGRITWSAEEAESGDELEGSYAVLLGPRNGARYPTRHRLDLGVRKTFRTGWGTLVPYVSVLNVYNQQNVLFYFYQLEQDPPVRTGLSMFPILPSLGLEVTF